MNNVSSPRTDDENVEQMIQTKNKTTPRITRDDLETSIVREEYFTAENGVNGELATRSDLQRDAANLRLLTFCVLVLKNGFLVTGESACASPENFDAESGRKIARENAVQKLWPLLGYQLKTTLYLTKE